MDMVAWVFLLLTLGGLGLPLRARAATPEHLALHDPELLLEAWTVKDGLPVNQINALCTGPEGFLWLSTFDGVLRFDGRSFASWRQAEWPAMPGNRFVDVFVFDGDVWAQAETGELVRMADEGPEVVPLTPFPDAAATHTLVRGGALWVGTTRGLAVLDADGGWAAVTPSAAAVHVAQLLPGGPGAWIVDGRGSLWHVDDTLQSVRIEALDGRKIHSLAPLSDGGALVSTRRGVVRVRGASISSLPGTEGRYLPRIRPGGTGAARSGWPAHWLAQDVGHWRLPAGSEVLSLAELRALVRDAEVLPGTTWQVRPDGVEVDGVALLDAPRQLMDVEQGPQGDTWLATQDGLLRLRPRLAHVPRTDLGAPTSALRAVLADRRGGIWALDQFGKVWQAPEPAAPFVERTPPGGGILGSLHEDTDGRVILARWSGPCAVQGGDCVPLAEQTSASTPTFALAMLRGPAGKLWVAAGRTLHRSETPDTSGSWDLLAGDPVGEGTPDPVFRALVLGPDDSVLVGSTRRGVEEWRSDGTRRPLSRGRLASERVRSLYLDEREVLWVGTEGGGLCRMAPWAEPEPEPVCLGRAEGLVDDVIHSVLPDEQGRLWMSSNQGIFWVRRAALDLFAQGGVDQVLSVALTEEHGMPLREANGGAQGAGSRAPDGRIWYATMAGLVWVDPAEVPLPDAPPVSLDAVQVDRDRVDVGLLGRQLALSPDQRDVTIWWSAPEFAWPERVRYRTRLVGWDEDWRAPTRETHATWTNLPSGGFTFEVQASLGGRWTPQPARLAIHRAPAFEETGLFQALLLLLGIGSVAGISLVRGRTLRRRQAHLEAAVVERTAELGERNAELERQRSRVVEQAGRLLEVDALRTRLVADLSHELRTPLTLVAGPLEALAGAGQGLSVEARAHVGLARRNASRLEELVEQLFDVARLDSGAVPLRVRPLELRAFIGQVVGRFAGRAEALGIALQVAPGSDEPLFFDPDLIDKVVGNLLGNALKFTSAGGRIEVRLCEGQGEDAAPDSGSVRVEVQDTGIGISEDQQRRLFERFYQGDSSRHEGAGIGLSLARDLVALHGGEIGVDSVHGEGSCFWFSLPRGADHFSLEDVDLSPRPPRADAQPAEAMVDWALPFERASEDAPRVLLVEDHPDLRAFLATHLARQFNVETAADGVEALEQIRAAPPEVVVSDVMMPRLDGLGLCRALRDDPATSAIPVLLVSAKASDEDWVDGLALAQDYLTKPVRPRELVARVGKLARQQGGGQGAAPTPPPAERSDTEPTADQAALARIEQTLRDHLDEVNFGVAELARAVGLSRRQLGRQLKRLAGHTPTTFMQSVRMAEAERLLEAGTFRTVSEVAWAVGLKPNYFTRLYTSWCGHPPSRRQRPAETPEG